MNDDLSRDALLARVRELEARIEALRQEQDRGILFFKRSVMGILIGDGNGIILDANPRALAMLGYGPGELNGADVRDIVHPDDQRTLAITAGVEAARAGRSMTVERRYRRKDGSWLAVQVDFSLLSDDGSLFQVMLQDISRRRAAEEAISAALLQAEAANLAKSAFLANMSHEIRTPLNGVMGMLQLLKATPHTDEQSDYLETALDEAGNLLRTLSDILDYSRLDAGDMHLSEKIFSLEDVLGRVMDAFKHAATAKNLRLTRSLNPAAPGRLRGDPERLRQLLSCLVANAVKYTPDGGRVSLGMRPGRPVEADDRVWLECAVADTGDGIAPELRDKVFEPFTQGDPFLTRRHGGVGLGLAMANGLTSLMGGDIRLEDAPDGGLVALVRLPFALPADDRSEPVAPEPSCLDGARVLVVDDETINRLTMRAMLRQLGCRPELADGARKALELLALQSFDCVLLDVQMPRRDGYQTARAIRAGENGVRDPDVPLVAITAHTGAEDRQAARDAGMDAYLTKPVDMRDLAQALNQVLRACRQDHVKDGKDASGGRGA